MAILAPENVYQNIGYAAAGGWPAEIVQLYKFAKINLNVLTTRIIILFKTGKQIMTKFWLKNFNKSRNFDQKSNFFKNRNFDRIFSKIECLIEFFQKSNVWWKIEILLKNLNFAQKSKFCSKIEILLKNRNLDENLEILVKNLNFDEKPKFFKK
mgnify:CR=1 FL=1